MGRKSIVFSPFLLFLVVFFQSPEPVFSSLNYTRYRQVSSLRLARIQKHLDKINKLPVFTIQSPDGDIIDCVHKRRQPALDHPLLKNHKIQKIPPQMPKGMKMARTDSAVDGGGSSIGSRKRVWQMWHHAGYRCPNGTIPIRRSSVGDVLRAKSLYEYGKKRTRRAVASTTVSVDHVEAPDVVGGNGHEHAIAYTAASGEVYGAKATINVWDPSIEALNEFSLSQIWVLSGSFDGADLNSIEAGWQSG